MKTEKNKPSRLTKALLETAKDMKDAGVLGKAAYEKITMRHLSLKDKNKLVEPLTGKGYSHDTRTSALEPSGFCPLSQLNGRVCFTIGAWFKASDRRGTRAAECDPAQRD